MKTIIQNGIVVNPEGSFKADVLIEGETITSISQHIIPQAGYQVIDAREQFVFPGGIDVHTHMANTHSADEFDSASIAAVVGGTTSMVVMTNSQKGQSVLDGVRDWKERAKSAVIDYSFHPTISGQHFNDTMLDEFHDLAEQEGITSIKMFMAYKGRSMVNDAMMYKVMKKAGELGIISNVHAENGDVIDEMVKEFLENGNTDPIYHAYTRPTIVEAEATARALAIAETCNAPVYIVHVSCAEALERIEQAKKRGVKAFAETCPHYLVLDEEYYRLPNFESAKYVCSPPLREKGQQDALWKGINSGVISTVGSDHSPFMFGQKTEGVINFLKIPNGLPGIEDRFSILYHFGVHEGRISMERFVDVVSATPAKLFGISKKGSISIGYDADVVILDPNRSKVITQKNQYQKSDYNLYEGMNIQGVITSVLSRGEVIAKDGRFIGELGRGRFLRRNKFQNISGLSNKIQVSLE